MNFSKTKGLSLIALASIFITVSLLYIKNQSKPVPVKVLANVSLPKPSYSSKTSIEEALKNRRSLRHYQNDPILLQHLSQILWSAQGVTSENGFRTAPSAGALYPLEVYVISGEVAGLEPGLYHYLPNQHALEYLAKGDIRTPLAKAALDQSVVASGAISIVITAVYKKTTQKYGRRGERFVHMEAGHAAENIGLQAVSLGLGTVTIGAFEDAQVQKLLNLPPAETPLYIMPIGTK